VKEAAPEFNSKMVYVYNDQIKTRNDKHFRNNKASFSSVKFDDFGNFLEISRVDKRGKVSDRYVSTYDTHGNELTTIGTGGDGELNYDQKYEYEYDSTGNWIKQTFYNFGKPSTVTVRHIIYK
jgi:hypothetical protein